MTPAGLPELLLHSEDWCAGFEVGVVYSLMQTGCDMIGGRYRGGNDEQFFALASQMGYRVAWKKAESGMVDMVFSRGDG